MRFKKIFAVLSAASIIASVASVNANAEDSHPLLTGISPYSIEYEITARGAVVSYVSVKDGVTEVEIPEKTDAGITVVGIKDFAFEYADVDHVIVPDTLKIESIGDAAFLSNADIAASVSSYGGSEKKALRFAANTVKFMGKSDWKGDEEELAPAAEILRSVLDTMGFTGSARADSKDITAEQAASAVARLYKADEFGERDFYVREDDTDDMTKMSEKSYDNFMAWVKLIPVNVTITGTKGTDAEKYAKGKAVLGIDFSEIVTHLIGDANQDGVVNVRDCAKIANALAFKTVDKLPCFTCADYNEDGEVTVRDAAQLANHLAHLK